MQLIDLLVIAIGLTDCIAILSNYHLHEALQTSKMLTLFYNTFIIVVFVISRMCHVNSREHHIG